jgi:hypothetical protein
MEQWKDWKMSVMRAWIGQMGINTIENGKMTASLRW